jgi:hypothetical protein
MTAIGSVVTRITGSPAPVLFLDSCILLDVVRAPRRNKASEVRVAQAFLDSVRRAPKTVHLLVGSPTRTEWNEHIDETVADCAGAVDGCNAVASICGYMALSAVAPLPADVLGLPALLRQLSADLLSAAVSMRHNAAALDRAVDRIISAKKPVKPGGKGAKDAVILEHAVEATTKLRAAGFAQTCVFVSSNTNDFAAPNSTDLHSVLAPVFDPIQLKYANSLTRAETILLAAGWVP